MNIEIQFFWGLIMILKRLITGAIFGCLSLSTVAHSALNNVLIYAYAAGFPHNQGIPDADSLIVKQGKLYNYTVTVTTDVNYMTYTNMKKYDLIIFNNTTGAVLPSATNQADFIKYMNEGGGYLGFHGAMDHKDYWQWYTDQGVSFNGHTGADAMVKLDTNKAVNKPEYEDIVKIFPKIPWMWREEWYSFKQNPRRNSDIILTVDEKTFVNAPIDPKQVMVDHPVAWAHRLPALPGSKKQGHYFYTAIGHGGYGKCFKTEIYVNEFVYQAMRWAAGEKDSIGPVRINPSRFLNTYKTDAISAVPGQLDVAVSDLGIHKVDVINMQGQRVNGAQGNGPSTHIFTNLNHESVYLVRIYTTKKTTTKRIFIQ